MKKHTATRTLIAAGALTALMTVSAFAYNVQGGTVKTASAVNFRQEPTTSSSVLDKLYNETRVAILDDTGDGWYKIAYNGKQGYMSSAYVETQPIMNIECGGAQVTTAVLNLRSGPGTENSIVAKLYEGTVCKIIGINNAWFKVQVNGFTGYISPDYVKIVPYNGSTGGKSTGTVKTGSSVAVQASSDTRQNVIDYAATLLGCKYVYGGTTTSGFDCSGFTRYVFANYGISLSHSSATQYTETTHIKKSELKAGDLVFFSQSKGGSKIGHVGIYVGNSQFIHAASPGKGVRYDNIDDSYYSSHYVASGRVLND